MDGHGVIEHSRQSSWKPRSPRYPRGTTRICIGFRDRARLEAQRTRHNPIPAIRLRDVSRGGQIKGASVIEREEKGKGKKKEKTGKESTRTELSRFVWATSRRSRFVREGGRRRGTSGMEERERESEGDGKRSRRTT